MQIQYTSSLLPNDHFTYDLAGDHLKKYSRGLGWQAADWFGYIPVVGLVVGIVRIIAAKALSIFADYGYYHTESKQNKHYYFMLLERANGEMQRGIFLELLFSSFPFHCFDDEIIRHVTYRPGTVAFGSGFYIDRPASIDSCMIGLSISDIIVPN